MVLNETKIYDNYANFNISLSLNKFGGYCDRKSKSYN